MVLVLLFISRVLADKNNCSVTNCFQCSSSSSKICIACEFGYQLSPPGCHISGEDYPVVIRNCLEANENQTKCKKCLPGYHLFEEFCEADCFENCVCFEPFKCMDGLIDEISPSNRKMQDNCSTNCEVCTAKGCSVCSTGYYLLSPFVCSKCESNCLVCTEKYVCKTCISGYFINRYNCDKCSSSCRTCAGSSTTCYSCNEGMKLNSRTCSSEDDDGGNTSTTGTIVGIVFSIIFIILFALLTYFCIKRKWYIPCYAYFCQRNSRAWLKKYYAKQAIIDSDSTSKQPDVISIQPTGQSHKVVDLTHSNIYPQNYAQNNPSYATIRGVQLNTANFNYEVKPIALDMYGKFNGQDFCLFCSNLLVKEPDQRVLPCGHAFHGRCAYDAIAIRGYKQCPVCKT